MAKKFTEDQLNWILSVNSTEAQQGIRQLTKANRELEKANKDRRQEMYKLEMQGKTETESYRRLTAVVKQNDIQIKSNRSLMKGLEDTLGLTSLTMSQLKKRAQDLQRQMDNTSKSLHPAEYNKLQTELVKVKNSMDDLKNAGKKTEETLGKTILSKGAAASLLGNIYTKAIEKLGQMVLKAKEFVSEGIKMAGMAQGIERAFNRISNPDTLSDLQKATKGSVNNLELMKAAVRASNFKIPLTELSTLLRFAQQRAQETGESVEYLTESIVTGIGRKSPLILDNLGISAVRLNEEISKTGDFTKAVGNIVREELSKSGESIDTAADRAQQRAALLQNIQMSIGQRMIEIVESSGSVWNSFLNVINKWVSIPTVEKIRDEQKEMNILARSIMAAEERTESRKLIIQEMQRQYPAFLANLDTEKLTNEQLSTRLQEVNKEYQNRIRVQVLNDKMLTPLREKQNELINKEQEGIIALSKYAELSGKYMSLSFRQSITSGNVLKMTQEEINKELETMEKRGAAKGLTLGINKTIKNLKQLPAEIQKVGDDINKTIDTIGSFGKNEDSPAQNPEPDKDLIEIEENKLKIAKEKKVTTKEALLLKNQEIAAIEKEIETLRYYGIEKEKIPPKNNPEKMVNPVENMRKSDTDKLNMLRNSYDVELSVIASGEKQKQSVIEQAFVSGKITRQQYDMLKLSLDVANAEDRLKIEQEYLQDVTDIELEIGEGKYQAIQNAGKRVLEADLKAHEARIAQQKSIQKAVTAVSDFKQQFNALAPEEETKLKLKALKA